MRANLVDRAEDWRWGSLFRWLSQPEPDPKLLTAWPIARLPNWAKRVNEPLSEKESDAVRCSVRQRHPAQEVTHATIFGWLQHKMPVIGHQLIAKNTARVTLQSLGKDLLERIVVSVFLKNRRPGIATVEGMVNTFRFIGSFWSGHASIVSQEAF